MNIAVIGLGNMGTPMALNLLHGGHAVTVYNRSSGKTKPLADAGARVANTTADAVRDAELAFTILSDDAALSEIVWGDAGLLTSLPRNAVHVSSSTISVALARRLTEAHAAHGQLFVGAPVFGRPDAAAAKRLLVILAGAADAVERVRFATDAIGRQTFVVGDQPWQAHAIKVWGNFLIASMLESFSEAAAAVSKAGIDPHAFFDIIVELFGSPIYKTYGGNIINKNFEPGFALRLGLKDSKLSIEAATEVNAPLPIASVIRDRFLAGVANGYGELDWSSISLIAALNAGLPADAPR